MSDFNIRIGYRNKDMKIVNEKVYDLKDYSEMLKLNLMHIIMDVENAFYDMNNGVGKDDWSEPVKQSFQKIRHKLLDNANAVQRIPDNLFYKNVPCFSLSVSEWISLMMNALHEDYEATPEAFEYEKMKAESGE